MQKDLIKNIEFEKKLKLYDLTDIASGGIESRTLAQKEKFTMTLFAFDKGEGISEYVMPGESMVYVYSGEVEIAIDGSSFPALKKGELIMVPADTLYSIDAVVECKLMILILKE